MTGEALFGGDSTPEVMLKHFEPLQLPEGLPDEWKPVLEAALEKKPEDRIHNVEDFLGQIKAVELFLMVTEQTIPEPDYQSDEQPNPQRSQETQPIPENKSRKPSYAFYLIIAFIIIVLLVIGFMPASWWCFFTLNRLPGCY